MSGRPGAEGAPRETDDEGVVGVSLLGCVLVVEVGWVAAGVMRRDWQVVLVCIVDGRT